MLETTDFVEAQTPEGLDLQRILNLVRRRHMPFLIALLIGWLAIWASAWFIAPRYESTTLILVEAPSMPTDYVAPNVSDDLQDRLQSITQQILSRTRLLSIIDKLHLYEGGRSPIPPDEKVDLMRKDIEVQLVQSSNTKQITGFTIGFTARDPRLAQQVTSELTDLFIDENLKVRQQESEDTTKFMENELQDAQNHLAQQEAAVRQFETEHEGDLPSQEASNLQILSGLQSELQHEEDDLNSAKQQGIYLQSLITQYKAFSPAVSTADGSTSDLATIDKELEGMRAKLADLSSQYTDSYPDIKSLKIEIAKTEKRRNDLIADSKKKDAHAPGAAVPVDESSRAQQASLAQLQSQLQANQAEIVNRNHSIADLKNRVSQYQSRLSAEPASEQQLADLNRGYDQSKATYDDLLKKKNESEMATSMELMQQGERFTMLDPPSLPVKPSSPNRLKLCGIGLAVGFALGLVVAGGLEFADDRLHSEKEIKALLPVSVISEIPIVEIPSDARHNKRKTILGWGMAALVFFVIAAGSALSYLHN